MTANLLRSVPAVARNLAPLRHAVCDVARAAGADEYAVADVALAVGEACGNVVVHAYPAGEVGPMTVTADVVDDGLDVVVADRGCGLEPRCDSPGLGLGLPLITSLAHSVVICAGAGGVGTEVRMSFDLDA